ncbi:MAG: hypothetical protein AABX70_03930 [Nanoarchaeota archaeon]
MQTKTLLQINTVIFAVVALIHLLRFLSGSPASIAGWDVPLWLSIVAFGVAGWLSWQNWEAR